MGGPCAKPKVSAYEAAKKAMMDASVSMSVSDEDDEEERETSWEWSDSVKRAWCVMLRPAMTVGKG